MGEIEVNKAVITVINIIIMLGLPIMLLWHVSQARRKEHLSEDWMMQIITVFVYGVAITAEIPALWGRWLSYYSVKVPLPDILYKISTWDRWSHMCLYIALYVLTYTYTRKKIPAIIRNTLS